MSTTLHANVSTLTYLKDPLKTFTFALFWSQIPPKTTKIRQPSTKEESFGHKTTQFSSVWGVVI
jgi:hypothetical protein